MATVVNIPAIQERFVTLGWTNVSIADVVSGLASAAIAAVELIAYLDALIAAPAGVNDQTIAGCLPADGSKITNYLKARGAVTV